MGLAMLRAFVIGSAVALFATVVATLCEMDVGATMLAVSPVSMYLGWRLVPAKVT
jgi:hypothetical protein